MKQCISFCLFFVGASTCFSQGKDADIKSLRYLREVEWPQAYKNQDTTLLDKILASEFQSIDAAGLVTNKQRELDYIKKHKPDYASFQFTVIRLDIFENGSAIVAGTGTVKGIGKEGNYVMTYQSSNFFVKRDNRWQAVGAHVSGVSRVAIN